MARPRGRPKTSFGAWLDSWLTAHPGYTLAAFGDEVGVSKSAVSLWLSGDTARIPIERLRRIAAVTEEPVENLEQMVYGRRPPIADSGITASADLIDAIAERMRTVLREEPAGYGIQRAARPTDDQEELARRRRYWLRLVRKDRRWTLATVARRAGKAPADVTRWERGGRIPDDELPAVARGYELPLDVIQRPPESDHDIAVTFRARWLAESERVPLGQVVNEQRAS